MSTVRDLYKAYTQQNFYIRKKFFDAVLNEEFHHSTNRFLKGKLAKGIQPRGKLWRKMLSDYVTAQRKNRWGKGKHIYRSIPSTPQLWPTPANTGEQ